jgi:hypothetical protein
VAPTVRRLAATFLFNLTPAVTAIAQPPRAVLGVFAANAHQPISEISSRHSVTTSRNPAPFLQYASSTLSRNLIMPSSSVASASFGPFSGSRSAFQVPATAGAAFVNVPTEFLTFGLLPGPGPSWRSCRARLRHHPADAAQKVITRAAFSCYHSVWRAP